jgi:Uncharacterized protein conserved in bacteria (DUF2334)
MNLGMIGSRWLPPGKTAAVVMSVDDVHPATSADDYEAGGDLNAGALGRLAQLQQRHPQLRATLSVTPDWRLRSLTPDAPLRKIPWLAKHLYWARRQRPGRFRVDRHPRFVEYLNGLQHCEVIQHGLTHTHRGPRFAVEFQDQSVERCGALVRRGREIFNAAGLKFARGFAPPAWNCPSALIASLELLGFDFLISARDIVSDVTRDAVTSMSGMPGVSLLYPQAVGQHGIVHLSTNFQATSSIDRALKILALNGVLHIKAHIFKSGGGHTMQDGLDQRYCAFLEAVFAEIKSNFGESVWWAHISEVAARARLHT